MQRSVHSMGRLHAGRSDSTSSALRTGVLTPVPTARHLPGGRGNFLSKSLTINSQSTGAGGGTECTVVRPSPPAEGTADKRQPSARRGSIGSMLSKGTGNRLEALVARPLLSLQLRPTAVAASAIRATSCGTEEDPMGGSSGGHHRATEVGTAAAAARAAQSQRELIRALARDHAQAKSSGGGSSAHRASTGCIPGDSSRSSSGGIVAAAGSLGGGGGMGGLSAVFPSARASQSLLPSIVGGVALRSIRPPAQPLHEPRPPRRASEPRGEGGISEASGDGSGGGGEDFLTVSPHVGGASGAKVLAGSRSIIGEWTKTRSGGGN